ncbi:hypothetical protein FDECE_18542, partial [Fusarium decemcellulare]
MTQFERTPRLPVEYYEDTLNKDGLCRLCASIPLDFPGANEAQTWTRTLGNGDQVQVGLRIGCRLCGLVLRQLGLDGHGSTKALQNCCIKLAISKNSELECHMVPHDHSSLAKSAILDVRYGPAPRERIRDADYALAFKRCDEEHVCFDYPDDLPTRLLDLESLPIVKLVEPKAGNRNTALSPDQIRNYRYAALSYCWGLSPPFTTTSVTIKERKEGFSIDQLEVPRTIAEAARVAHGSGLKYLWVDALCIIQGRDDVAGADWRRESERMRLVYGGAYVTIVAAGTSDASGGLILGKPTCVLTSPGRDIVALTLKISDPDSDAPFWKEAIFSRAWTCQEWYLSSRLLVFTSTAVYFRCQETDFPSSVTSHGSFKSVLPSSRRLYSAKPWSMFVVNFAARNMTNPTDKLPAIAGLARNFHEFGGDTLGKYYAGMWEKEIL